MSEPVNMPKESTWCLQFTDNAGVKHAFSLDTHEAGGMYRIYGLCALSVAHKIAHEHPGTPSAFTLDQLEKTLKMTFYDPERQKIYQPGWIKTPDNCELLLRDGRHNVRVEFGKLSELKTPYDLPKKEQGVVMGLRFFCRRRLPKAMFTLDQQHRILAMLKYVLPMLTLLSLADEGKDAFMPKVPLPEVEGMIRFLEESIQSQKTVGYVFVRVDKSLPSACTTDGIVFHK